MNTELLNRPWAIRAEAVPHLLAMDAATVAADAATTAAATEAATAYTGSTGGKIAVVPVRGVLFGYKYAAITNAVETAAANPEVKRIVLSVDSPGGEALGCPETGAVIAAAAKVKPVSAIVEGHAASAAYWLASQASDITLTPSGEVGSVGVRMLHGDVSQMYEKAGIKITEIQAGQFKTEGSPYKPLSEEALANMQTSLDATHTDFLNAVSTGRGSRASAEIAGQRFGEGRMFGSADAVKHGLVDRVQAPRDFYRAIAPAAESTPAPSFPIRAARERIAIQRAR